MNKPQRGHQNKRLAHIDGAPQGHYYDRLIQREDGTWVGLEVKSGQSPPHGTQRAADSMVSPDHPARARLDDGRTIEITEVQMKRVEKQQRDALPTKQMAKMG